MHVEASKLRKLAGPRWLDGGKLLSFCGRRKRRTGNADDERMPHTDGFDARIQALPKDEVVQSREAANKCGGKGRSAWRDGEARESR